MKTITIESINELVAIIKYASTNNIKNFNVILNRKQESNTIKQLMNCYFNFDEDNNIVALGCHLFSGTDIETITYCHFIIPFELPYNKIKEMLIDNLTSFKNTDFFDSPVISPYNDLYNLCNNNDWFTQGDNSQYQKLFEANTSVNFSFEQIATIIWVCSDNSKWNYENILLELNNQYNKYLESLIDYFILYEL